MTNMASIESIWTSPEIDYPDSDGKPMGETPWHRDNILQLIEMLRGWYANNPLAYVTGNMFLYYVPGDKRRHVSPDVFVALDVPKHPERPCWLTWKEGKAPDVVVEFTSASTQEEDLRDKFAIYRDKLKVREYFLFDPREEYLTPSLQGYRLQRGRYVPIRAVKGRLTSNVLGLQLVRDDWQLRLYDPKTKKRLLTPTEIGYAERERADAEYERAEAVIAQAAEDRRKAEAEVARLREELKSLRRQMRNK
jgi:Uma2 family endonuclease